MLCLFRLANVSGIDSAFLIGDFNNWSSTADPMEWADDRWQTSVDIAPGDYRYAYVLVHATAEGGARLELSCAGSELHVPTRSEDHPVNGSPVVHAFL